MSKTKTGDIGMRITGMSSPGRVAFEVENLSESEKRRLQAIMIAAVDELRDARSQQVR